MSVKQILKQIGETNFDKKKWICTWVPDNILHCTSLVSGSVENRKFLLMHCEQKTFNDEICMMKAENFC